MHRETLYFTKLDYRSFLYVFTINLVATEALELYMSLLRIRFAKCSEKCNVKRFILQIYNYVDLFYSVLKIIISNTTIHIFKKWVG